MQFQLSLFVSKFTKFLADSNTKHSVLIRINQAISHA